MPKDKGSKESSKKPNKEDLEGAVVCSECGALYEEGKNTRWVVEQLGHFVCPRCQIKMMDDQRGS